MQRMILDQILAEPVLVKCLLHLVYDEFLQVVEMGKIGMNIWMHYLLNNSSRYLLMTQVRLAQEEYCVMKMVDMEERQLNGDM